MRCKSFDADLAPSLDKSVRHRGETETLYSFENDLETLTPVAKGLPTYLKWEFRLDFYHPENDTLKSLSRRKAHERTLRTNTDPPIHRSSNPTQHGVNQLIATP